MDDVAEIEPETRQNTRHAVRLRCDLVSEYWDEAVSHTATELSARGMWIETPYPLKTGERLEVAFTPPCWGKGRRVVVRARVCHVERRHPRSGHHRITPGKPGMGIAFENLNDRVAEELHHALQGWPPSLHAPRAGKSTGKIFAHVTAA